MEVYKERGLSSTETSKTYDDRPSVNLVLSGGGVKGVAHIALIESLEEAGIKINAISGSSAGALVGALYGSGLKPNQILDFFKSTPLFRYTWLNPTKAGFFDSDKYESVIGKYVKDDFESLHISLHIAAVNIEQGEVVYFDKGKLVKPLLASCAVPAVFSPVEIDGGLYSDGGVMDNFPIQPLRDGKLPLLGSYVCKPEIKEKKGLNSILKVTNHSNALLMYSANSYKFSYTYNTVVFPLGKYSTFDTKRIDEIYEEAKTFLVKARSIKQLNNIHLL